MKRFVYLLGLILFFSLFVLVSCDTDGFTTPTITGTISIPIGLNLRGSDFFVKTIDEDGMTVSVIRAEKDRTFTIKNLEENKKYNILVTTKEPAFENNRELEQSTGGYGGWIKDVVAKIDKGNNIGNITVKPLGIINGKVMFEESAPAVDTMVFIPGTSFMAMTNENGVFSISSVPQGAYTLRFIPNDGNYSSVSVKNIVLDSASDLIVPQITIEDVTLYRNTGSISGKISLSDGAEPSGVIVLLKSKTDSRIKDNDISDEDGSFSFTGIPAEGEYFLTFSKTGYVTESIIAEVSFGKNTEIDEFVMSPVYSKVEGTVELENASDFIGISVLLKSDTLQYSTSTDDKGRYSFTQIEPGNYRLYVSKSDYISQMIDEITVGKSVSVKLNNLKLLKLNTEQYGTVSGKVILPGMLDCSGVFIEASFTEGGSEKIISVVSNYDGTYELSGVPKTGSVTVKYSKNGWDTKTETVNLCLGATKDITLEDNSVPVINSIIINDNSHTTIERDVVIHINASDEGSGLSKIIINDGVSEYPYQSDFNFRLSQGDGEKTIKIKLKDGSDNVSEEKSISIILAGQSIKVSGTLQGTDIKWVKAQSPYCVTGDIVVPEGCTLSIEEGVDVQFAGSYSITVNGTLKADSASFYGIGNGTETWKGINCVNNNGSEIKNSVITASKDAISGIVLIQNCTVTGSLWCEKSSIIGCSVSSTDTNGISMLSGCYIADSVFSKASLQILSCTCENNKFESMSLSAFATGMKNVSFIGCSVNFTGGGLYKNCRIESCLWKTVDAKLFNVEVNNKGDVPAGTDIGYCSNTDGIGYLGDAYYSGKTESGPYRIGDKGPGGGTVFYDKGYFSQGWRYLEVADAKYDVTSTKFGLFSVKGSTCTVGTSSFVGCGKLNTELLACAMQTTVVKSIWGYKAGGQSDWFLPSIDELKLLKKNLGSGADGLFLSSTEAGLNSVYVINASGSEVEALRDKVIANSTFHIRRVRAF